MIEPADRPSRRSLLAFAVVAGVLGSGFASRDEQTIMAEMNDAVEQVKRIVNAPVTALPLDPDAAVGKFEPGWFHQGAIKPSFLAADVRSTQQFPYDKWEYVTSDLNPGVMFRGHDLEFNALTKYFYTDYSLPKKRLGPDEMAEINRLYRIIGEREQELAQLRAPAKAASTASAEDTPEPRPIALYGIAGALAVVLGIVVFVRRRSAD